MKKVAIIGAGISGLSIANLFKKNLNYEIIVYEKNGLTDLEEGYGIQLSVNSVKILNQIGFDKFQNDTRFSHRYYESYTSTIESTGKFYSDLRTQRTSDQVLLHFQSSPIWYQLLPVGKW